MTTYHCYRDPACHPNPDNPQQAKHSILCTAANQRGDQYATGLSDVDQAAQYIRRNGRADHHRGAA